MQKAVPRFHLDVIQINKLLEEKMLGHCKRLFYCIITKLRVFQEESVCQMNSFIWQYQTHKWQLMPYQIFYQKSTHINLCLSIFSTCVFLSEI